MERTEVGVHNTKRGAFVTYHKRIETTEYLYIYDPKEIKLYSAKADDYIRKFSIKEYNHINNLTKENEIKEIVYVTDCLFNNPSLLVCSRTSNNLYHCFVCDIVNLEYQLLPIALDSKIPSINDVVSDKIEVNNEIPSYVVVFASVNGLSIYWLTYDPYNQRFIYKRDLNIKLSTKDSVTAVNTYNDLDEDFGDKNVFCVLAGGVQGNIEHFRIMNDGSKYEKCSTPMLELTDTSDPVPPVTHIVIRTLGSLKERLLFIGYGKLNSRIFNRSTLARLDRVPIVRISRISFNDEKKSWKDVSIVVGNPGADVTKGEIITMFVTLTTLTEIEYNLYVALDMYYRPNDYRPHDGIEVTHYKIEDLKDVTVNWHRIDSICRKSSNINEFPLLDIYADQYNGGLKLLLPNEFEWYQISPLPVDSDDDDDIPSFDKWFGNLEFNQIGPYNSESIKDINAQREKYEDELMIDILFEKEDVDKNLYPPQTKTELNELFDRIFNENKDNLVWKYGIIYYLLRDWKFLTKHSQKFATRYLISSQEAQIFIDGCWELDHERFEGGLGHLSDPIVKKLLAQFPKIDEKIMKIFLVSSCPDHALRYSHYRCITTSSVEMMELYIEAVVNNNILNIREALKFSRGNKSEDDENIRERLLKKLLDICILEDKTETREYEKEFLSLSLDKYEEKFILKYWENSKEPKLLWFYIKELKEIENYRDSLIYFQVYKWFKKAYLKIELTSNELQFGVNIESKKNEEDSDEEELEDDVKEKLNHYKKLFTGTQSFSDQMGINLNSSAQRFKSSQEEIKKRKRQEKEKYYEQQGVKRDKVTPLLRNRSPLSASNSNNM